MTTPAGLSWNDAIAAVHSPGQMFELVDAEVRGVIKRESGRYGDSQFYQANGRYSMMHTCNRWTAEALDKTGMDLPYRLMLTSGSVMRAARKKGQSCELD